MHHTDHTQQTRSRSWRSYNKSGIDTPRKVQIMELICQTCEIAPETSTAPTTASMAKSRHYSIGKGSSYFIPAELKKRERWKPFHLASLVKAAERPAWPAGFLQLIPEALQGRARLGGPKQCGHHPSCPKTIAIRVNLQAVAPRPRLHTEDCRILREEKTVHIGENPRPTTLRMGERAGTGGTKKITSPWRSNGQSRTLRCIAWTRIAFRRPRSGAVNFRHAFC